MLRDCTSVLYLLEPLIKKMRWMQKLQHCTIMSLCLTERAESGHCQTGFQFQFLHCSDCICKPDSASNGKAKLTAVHWLSKMAFEDGLHVARRRSALLLHSLSHSSLVGLKLVERFDCAPVSHLSYIHRCLGDFQQFYLQSKEGNTLRPGQYKPNLDAVRTKLEPKPQRLALPSFAVFLCNIWQFLICPL